MVERFSKDWQKFERIVTAIHLAKMQGASVVWNEEIKGRQFDVTIRFKQGLYSYLTLIECKRHKNPIPVEKVEAFVTKSRDANADKAIMISSSPFQSGCIEVAQRHNLELFTLRKSCQIPEEFVGERNLPAWNIFKVCLIWDLDENCYSTLPEDNGQLHYLVKNSVLISENLRINLETLIDRHLEAISLKDFHRTKTEEITLKNSVIDVPNLFIGKTIQALRFSYNLIEVNEYKGLPLDSHQIESIHTTYELFDVTRNQTTNIEALGLNLGFDTVLEPGKFYTNPTLGLNYFCQKLEANQVQMFLVESYGKGNLIQAEFIQDIKYQKQYLEILDKNEIKRLKKMYEKIQQEE
jgi:hypothetical protein